MGRKLTTEEFIEKARSVHSDDYDYSKVVYVYNKIKVIINCPTHGDFEQTPKNHIMGQGCPLCSSSVMSTAEEFIKKAKVVHNGKYDYSKVEYAGAHKKVIINCPTHGNFKQAPRAHLDGQGCPGCSSNTKLSTEEFIKKAKVVHNGKYDYSKVEYGGSKMKVIINCPTHGDFEQRPDKHLDGQGCPHCKKPRTSYDKMTVEQRQRVKDVYTYHLRFEGNGELFDKIGISGDLPKRLYDIQRDSKNAYKLVSGYTRKYDNADLAYQKEQELLNSLHIDKGVKYRPQIPFGGDTECIIPRGNPNMFDSSCIPKRSDRFNYDDYKG